MTNDLRVLMLLTDGFGSLGGIAKFNGDFLRALDGCPLVQRVHALPRILPEPMREPIPEYVVYDRAAARGKVAFMRRVASHLWRGGQFNLVICGHLHLLAAAWLMARLCGARLVLIIHGVEAWSPSRKKLANWLAPRVDALIAVSKYSAERFTRWSKLPRDRIFILPNCVDLSRFRAEPCDARLLKRYRLRSSNVIMTVGRLASTERYKGFDQVLELMPKLIERFPSLKYLIVGEGDDRPRLQAKAAALGLSEHTIFTGQIPESEKVAHYNLADAFVMPSTGEGFGIVLIEAAACGVPVVGSKIDASREALLDGRLGHLVDPSRSNELFEAVAAILDGHVRRGRIDAIDKFSTEKFRARVADWCNEQGVRIAA